MDALIEQQIEQYLPIAALTGKPQVWLSKAETVRAIRAAVLDISAVMLDALRAARKQVAADREALHQCHANPVTGKLNDGDALGLAALAEYDAVLAQIDAAIAAALNFTLRTDSIPRWKN